MARKSPKKKTVKRARMVKRKEQRDKSGKFLPGFSGGKFGGRPGKNLTQSEVFQELLSCHKIKIELFKSTEVKTPIKNESGKVTNWNTEDIDAHKKIIEYDLGESTDFRRLIFGVLIEIMLKGGREGVMAAQELLRRGDSDKKPDDKSISDMTIEEIEEEIKSIDDTTRKLIEFKKTAS